jgi:hypothetical protein
MKKLDLHIPVKGLLTIPKYFILNFVEIWYEGLSQMYALLFPFLIKFKGKHQNRNPIRNPVG